MSRVSISLWLLLIYKYTYFLITKQNKTKQNKKCNKKKYPNGKRVTLAWIAKLSKFIFFLITSLLVILFQV